jgi:hypothetical protein
MAAAASHPRRSALRLAAQLGGGFSETELFEDREQFVPPALAR